jgi:hypothetical protein
MDAILVCHGIGMQVRFETVDCVTRQLLREHTARGGLEPTVQVRQTLHANKLLPRAELTLPLPDGSVRDVHIYEAYWAPIPEGRVSAGDVARFLFTSTWNGLRNSAFGSFERWMFGGLQRCEYRSAMLYLAALLLLVLTTVWAAWLVSFVLVVWHAGSVLQSAIGHLGQLTITGWTVMQAVLWLGSFGGALLVRSTLIQYLGDIAAYVFAHDVNKFAQIREEIQATATEVAEHVFQSRTLQKTPLYERVFVLGHSLGTVVAYDTLNRLIAQDLAHTGTSDIPRRTGLFLTFGSPLDKTAFIFRTQQKAAPIREQYAAVKQPLILDYAYRPQRWINLHASRDWISGALNYYDAPGSAGGERHIQNLRVSSAWNPLAAHLQYWEGADVRRLVYDALLSAPISAPTVPLAV